MKKLCNYCNKEYEWDGIKRYPKGCGLGFSFEKYCSRECSKNDNITKMKKTTVEKHGAIGFAAKDIKKKSQDTRQEKYGNLNYTNIEQAKKTNLEKYDGMGFGSKKIVEKYKQTNINRNGEEWYTNRKQAIETQIKQYGGVGFGLPENQSKCKQAIQEKYNGIGWGSKELWKRHHETKKKNGSYKKSKIEDKIYDLLLTKFSIVERQYSSDIYPWNCDFYIPELELYIEYQGFWHHGKEPYNNTKAEHRKIVNSWKEKTEIQYSRAIYGWTIADPKKRAYVKEYKVNWIEFFNEKEFSDWFNNYIV